MDTPCSGSPSCQSCPTFPPPAAELDDHRFQPHSLPRSGFLRAQLEGSRTHSRNNESAVYDETDMLPAFHGVDHAAVSLRVPTARSIDERSMHFPSDISTRSLSPPNSVDAFADPEHRRMRERSGTVTSQVPNELRSNSRRPTFVETDGCICGSATNLLLKPEEDVCFPPDESRICGATIDFDEINEFVALQARERSGQCQRKTSTTGSFKGCYNSNPPVVAVSERMVADESSSSVIDEKGGSGLPQVPRISKTDRFSFFSSEMDATIHAPKIGELLLEGESFQDLFRAGQGVWWLDCLDPSVEELSMLMKAFAIHPLTAEDIRMQETREKVELFKCYYFVCFRSFVQQKELGSYMEPINVYLIVFREGVLSFHFAPSNHSASVRRRIRQLRDYVALSADWICYALIDDIVDSFAPLITDIERDSDSIEDAVFTARDDDYTALLKRIGDCRKRTMAGMRLLGGKADVIKGFAKRCNEQYQITPRGEIGLYLGDIQDHILTMMGNLSHFEKMLSRSQANYLAQLSMDSNRAGNRANEVLGKITTIATILLPLNLICGLFGMNVPVPGRETTGLGWFFGILGTIIMFSIVCFFTAKRLKFV